MKKEIIKLIIGIYSAIAITICGYYYINPIKIYLKDQGMIRILGPGPHVVGLDYTEFQYSILLSIVAGILLITILNFIKTK
jgi:hypothetical protein